MAYSFIQSVDGVDTLALRKNHPELFNVTVKDGSESWTLRPEVLAAIRAPQQARIDAATRAFETAKETLKQRGAGKDKAAAIRAALHLKAVLEDGGGPTQ